LFDGFDDDMTFTLTLKRSEVSGHAGAIQVVSVESVSIPVEREQVELAVQRLR